MTVLKENNLLNSLSVSEVELKDKKEAIALLSSMSFPTRKTEDWKYTSVSKILKKDFQQIFSETPVDISDFLIPDLDAHIVVLVNGVYSSEASDFENNEGIIIQSLSETLKEKTKVFEAKFNSIAQNKTEIFTALNTGYFNDGVLLHIPKNKVVNKPIHVIHINTKNDVISNPRFLFVTDAFSEVSIIQSFVSKNVKNCFTNAVTEIFVGENAKVVIDKTQAEQKDNNLICTEQIYQEKNSSFKINTFTISGDFVRNGVTIDVKGENCSSEMNGLYLLKGKQHVDNHTKVNHIYPNCTSSELYKGVLYDKSTGVFNGKVIVFEDAQKIEAYQQNKNILISSDASMNAKPELEIYADDVKCSHGSTTGQFDEEAIFYLQARGVSKLAAKKMLVDAFAEEVTEKVDNETVRNWLINMH